MSAAGRQNSGVDLRLLQRSEQLLRMFSSIHLVVDLGDQTVRSDHVGMAVSRLIRRAAAGSVRRADRTFGIAQQRVRKILIFGELGVGFLGVRADAENLDVLRFILLDSITESDAFGRSPTSAGARVKPEYHGFTGVVAETHFPPRVVLNRKLRGFVTH